MRALLLPIAAALSSVLLGQSAPRDFFVINPYEANGYFITTPALLDQLGADHIKVDIVSRTDDGQGGTANTVVQTFELDRTTLHGHASRTLIEALPSGTEVVYDAFALDGGNNDVGVIHAWNPGPILSEKCNLICEQNRHGWRLTAFADAGNGYTTIDIGDPARYFFVTTHNGHWQEFKNQNAAVQYGFSSWSSFECLPGSPGCLFNFSSDCFRISGPNSSNNQTTTCVGLPDENGYPLPPTVAGSPCWAIRKDKGDWRNLWTSAYEVFNLGVMCDAQPGTGASNLLPYYNADNLVEQHIAALPPSPGPGPLGCPNGSFSSASESLGNGLPINCSWIEMLTNTAVENDDGTLDIVQSILYVLHCEEGGVGSEWPSVAPLYEGLTSVSGVVVRKWEDGYVHDVVSVPIPKAADGKALDPKLIKVTKQQLEPGLYEVMVTHTNGRIARHFQELTESVVIGASFASFVHTNIYPVPVRDQVFAIDFNLAFPTNIQLDIVNSMGMPYHSEALSFALEGKNKHVVKMITPWPAGIYHAVFQFADGSTASKTFTVAEN